MNLSGATNATIVVAQGIGTIINDDASPPPTAAVIPTLGEWPLAALALLLAVAAFAALRGRGR